MPPDAVKPNDVDLHPCPRSRGTSHEMWRYSLRQTKQGEWLLERGQADAGGVFVTLGAAIRFLRADLDDMVVSGHGGGRS